MQEQLSTHYPLKPEQIEKYQQDGYIKLQEVLSPEILDYYGRAISQLVFKLNTQETPLAQRNTYSKAFLQIGNLWEHCDTVREFALSSRLGRIAAELMQVGGVRMYHDQALFKEASGGFTPWHADQFYWPMSTNHCVTAWIPLQPVTMEMGPLAFCMGSQKILAHRDIAISDESEQLISRSLQDYPKDETPYELGEVSFHAGWTFHRAGPNTTEKMRGVMTIIYMEDGMIAAQPKNPSQQNDLARWFPGVKVGEKADSALNPVIYNSSE